MEKTDIAHEQELKEKKLRNWLRADYGIKYLRDGLEKFVDDAVKKQYKRIMKKYKNRKCRQCNFQTLRPKHIKSLFNTCPFKQEHCFCLTDSRLKPCRNQICDSIYDEILTLYFFNPPTPCWKNSDIKEWYDDPWAIAKCFISFPGYKLKAGPSEIDCTGLLHILINNKGLHHHLNCKITRNGTDVFCRVRRTRENVVRNPKHELEDKDLDEYIDDMIKILSDKKELLSRPEAAEAVSKLLQLKENDFVFGSGASRDNSEDNLSNTRLQDLQQPYTSKYESEYIHIGKLGKGAFGVVFEAQNKVDQLSYAVKRIALRRSDTLKEKVSREVRALASLEHPNIVRYYHAWMESPPLGWQEQKDHQLDMSESLSSGTASSATNTTASAFKIVNSISSQTERQNIGGNNDKKETLFDKLQNPFGQTNISFETQEIQNDSSGTWDSFDKITLSLTEGCREGDGSFIYEDKSSEAVMPPLPEKSIVTCPQNQPILNEEDNQNKPIEKVSSLKGKSTQAGNQKLFFYIQMQLCKPETLAHWLKENTLNRDKQQVLEWFVQILSAVRYVHDKGFLHRDLKPSNIFFSAENMVKVGDFGFATALEEELDLDIYSEAGTYLYMSPEILNKRGKIKSNKVDIYSLGVILFELLFSFHTQSERVRTLEDLKKLRFPDNFTREMPEKKDLVTQMLAHNPEERPTAEHIHNQIIFTQKTNTTRRNSV